MKSKLGTSLGAAIVVTLFSLTLVETASSAPAAATGPEEAKAIAKAYGGKLKAMLQAEMGRGGPTAAIPVCSDKAMQIGSEMSRSSGWSVRRVSTKARNPLDVPDAYELGVLADFERQLASGKAEAARFEVVTENGVKYARFMKAVKVDGVCLACHGGKEVTPETAAALKAGYPHDTARNYKLGDLRGAVSLKKKLSD